MVAAMKSVIDENTPILQAAEMHGVSKSTLQDRISGNVVHGDKPGPDPLLSSAEEEELSNFLIEVAQAGYGKTRKEVRHITGRVAVDKKKKRHLMYRIGGFKGSCKGIHICHIERVILWLMLE